MVETARGGVQAGLKRARWRGVAHARRLHRKYKPSAVKISVTAYERHRIAAPVEIPRLKTDMKGHAG